VEQPVYRIKEYLTGLMKFLTTTSEIVLESAGANFLFKLAIGNVLNIGNIM
jgi:hypothetical protein